MWATKEAQMDPEAQDPVNGEDFLGTQDDEVDG